MFSSVSSPISEKNLIPGEQGHPNGLNFNMRHRSKYDYGRHKHKVLRKYAYQKYGHMGKKHSGMLPSAMSSATDSATDVFGSTQGSATDLLGGASLMMSSRTLNSSLNRSQDLRKNLKSVEFNSSTSLDAVGGGRATIKGASHISSMPELPSLYDQSLSRSLRDLKLKDELQASGGALTHRTHKSQATKVSLNNRTNNNMNMNLNANMNTMMSSTGTNFNRSMGGMSARSYGSTQLQSVLGLGSTHRRDGSLDAHANRLEQRLLNENLFAATGCDWSKMQQNPQFNRTTGKFFGHSSNEMQS